MLAPPVSSRFSTSGVVVRSNAIEDCTVSVPSPAFSPISSPVSSMI
jgi:hypothetical protein